MPQDPFPRDRVAAMLRRMPAYVRLAWRLAKDPLLGRARRAAVVGAAGYLASPIDLVPGVIPVIGQLDDLAVALAAIRLALAGLSPERRREHLDAVGLADADLVGDLRTVGATTAWIGRASFRATRRVATSGARVAVASAGVAARTTRAAADRAAPAAKAASAQASRAAPIVKATGRAALDAGSRVASTGGRAFAASSRAVAASGRAIGAAGAKVRGLPRPAGLGHHQPADPEVLVTEVDVPLLPPPPPSPTR